MIRLATGPVSWGVDFLGAPGNPPARVVVDGIREAGYEGTELGPLGYLDDLGGLELTGGFVFEPLDRPTRAAEVARRVAALGGGYVLLIDAVGEPGGLAAVLDGLALAADAVRAVGLRPLVHPHAGSRIETEAEITAALEVCDLCVDTGHCAYAGVDPSRLIAEAGERVGCVHLKDLDPRHVRSDFWASVEAGAFVPVGRGAVDFAGVLATLRGMGYEGWAVVEQDRAADPVAELIESRLVLERLLARGAV